MQPSVTHFMAIKARPHRPSRQITINCRLRDLITTLYVVVRGVLSRSSYIAKLTDGQSDVGRAGLSREFEWPTICRQFRPDYFSSAGQRHGARRAWRHALTFDAGRWAVTIRVKCRSRRNVYTIVERAKIAGLKRVISDSWTIKRVSSAQKNFRFFRNLFTLYIQVAQKSKQLSRIVIKSY